MSKSYIDEDIIKASLGKDHRFINWRIETERYNERVFVYLHDRFSKFPFTIESTHFGLQEMPGCCGILVSTDTYVAKSQRGKGIAQLMQQMKEVAARATGYQVLFCTVNISDPESSVQEHILKKTGWKEVALFKNLRTKNQVMTYMKEVPPAPKCPKCETFSTAEVAVGIPWCSVCNWQITP